MMSIRWQHAWMIARTDLLRYKLGLFITILISIFMGIYTNLMLQEAIARNMDSQYISTLMDFMVLIWVSNLGFIYNRRSFKYWSEDSYRKYLIKLRTQPIGMKTIIWARYMTMSMAMMINGITFFTTQYIYMSEIEMITRESFFAYVLVMIVFSTMVHSLYVWMEWRFDGKKYMVGVTIFMGVILLSAILVGWSGHSILLMTLELVTTWPIFTSVVAAVLLIQSLTVGMRLSFNTLRKADLM